MQGPPRELRDWLSYDPATGNFTWLRSGNNRVQVGQIAGTVDHDGYRRIFFQRRSYAAHRLAWWFYHGGWPTSLLDHVNGQRADNRIANLRTTDPAGNARNRRSAAGSTSRYLGVSRYQSRSWHAQIKSGGRVISLGYFRDEMAAATAYDAAARIYHGAFARPNFPG